MNLKKFQLSLRSNVALAGLVAHAVEFVPSEQSFGLAGVICLIFMLSQDNAEQDGKQTQYQDLCI